MIKSPFLIVKDFMSPMECETLLGSIDISIPNYDQNDDPIKTVLRLPIFQQRVWNRMEEYFSDIEDYYSVEVDSLTPVDIEWYPERCVDEPKRCENSRYFNNKWKLINDYDFTVVVFLKDYNNKRDFDEEFECYGGKLEISNHGFSFNPVRGMAVIFPSNQYFINRTETPQFGDAFQLRFHIVCSERFNYNREHYQGNHSIWFKGLT